MRMVCMNVPLSFFPLLHLLPNFSSNPLRLHSWNPRIQRTELKVTDVVTLMDYLPPKGEACWPSCISSGWVVWDLSAVGRLPE